MISGVLILATCYGLVINVVNRLIVDTSTWIKLSEPWPGRDNSLTCATM